MKPTLYDILGVPPDAGRGEIKAAWRDAADRFEPGSGGSSAQFRLFNEAAEVLLDPGRRREYDAQLTRERGERPAPESATEADRGTEPAPAVASAPAAAAGTEGTTRAVGGDRATAAEGRAGRRVLPLWVVAVVGVVATLAVAVAAVLGVGAQALGFLDFPSAVQAEAIEDARQNAPAAAQRAAVAMLSYDHESLESDRDNAAKFLTEDYRKEYLDTFELVLRNAPEVEAEVEAEVRATAVMLDPTDDTDRVRVLLFVNQTTRSTANEEPQTALNRVVLTMAKVDGSWLVDGVSSY